MFKTQDSWLNSCGISQPRLSRGTNTAAEAGEAEAGEAEAENAGTRPPHFGPEALLKSVESGAIAPLRGRWVVDLDANDGRLKRRQDLPPEAFFPADELRRLTEALGDDYGLLFAGLS